VRARSAAILGIAIFALSVVGASGAQGERSVLRFLSASQHAFPGELAQATIRVRPAGVRCILAVRYADGSAQSGLRVVRAAGGRARWEWRVPDDVEAGNARLTVTCAKAGRVTRLLPIVGALIEAKINVDKSGFSIRPGQRAGAEVSYGLLLRNTSPNQDAYHVNVQVNFVDDENRLWGSKAVRVVGIPAGQTFAFGNSLTFPSVPPVTRLEAIVQIGSRAPAAKRPPFLATVPGVRDVGITPGGDPEWVGFVHGELINQHPRLILARTSISTVLFDHFGNVVGGGMGNSSFVLPPSGRAVWKLGSGVRAVPMLNAASAQVSFTPTYNQPGA
jgi:hypothetical protein